MIYAIICYPGELHSLWKNKTEAEKEAGNLGEWYRVEEYELNGAQE